MTDVNNCELELTSDLSAIEVYDVKSGTSIIGKIVNFSKLDNVWRSYKTIKNKNKKSEFYLGISNTKDEALEKIFNDTNLK